MKCSPVVHLFIFVYLVPYIILKFKKNYVTLAKLIYHIKRQTGNISYVSNLQEPKLNYCLYNYHTRKSF